MNPLTTTGRVLTTLVLVFAGANVAVGVSVGTPWLTVAMLGFLLLCQVAVTAFESHRSATQECQSVTSLLTSTPLPWDNQKRAPATAGTVPGHGRSRGDRHERV